MKIMNLNSQLIIQIKYAGIIRDKGREYENYDLYWFGSILDDLHLVPKFYLRFQSTIFLFNSGIREAFIIPQV